MKSSDSDCVSWKAKKTSVVIKQKLENNEVLINNYRIIQKIGQGRFGKVKLCERIGENSTKNRQFALKIFSKRELLRRKDYRTIQENGIIKMQVVTALDRVQDEINLMSSLYHRNVVLLFESLESDECDKIYLVMELMENGPCMKYNPDAKRFTSPLTGGCLDEFRARNHIKDIVNGVLYLHSNKICHRDLKVRKKA
jgi:serine/threonine protein kinase